MVSNVFLIKVVFRGRIVLGSLFFILVMLFFSYLSCVFSGRQPATVALDTGFSLIRTFAPLIIVFMVQELFSKEFDRKYYFLSLSYPCSRNLFMIRRFLILLLSSVWLLFFFGLALGLLVAWVNIGYIQNTPVDLGIPYFFSMVFLFVDIFVILAFAVFLAVASSTTFFVLVGSLGFMMISRSFADIVNLLTQHAWLVEDGERYRESVSFLSYLLPDLGALDVREISLYSKMALLPTDWWVSLISCLVYGFGLALLSVWLFNCKKFV